MNKIAITGGKGGTGKSTIATALSYELSKKFKVLLIDADVDCPNDSLILGIKQKKVKDVENMIPGIDKTQCKKCSICSRVCKENAIVHIKGKFPIVIPEQCSGCKACRIACPHNAIIEKKQKIGEIFQGKKESLTLMTGKIKPGIEESSLVVNQLKEYFKDKEKKYDYVIIDTAAGTHCPVISALLGAEKAIAVTEPTPLGKHDLQLILSLMKKLRIPSSIIINRSDIADKNIIEQVSKDEKIPIISEIPYSKEIEESYSNGIPIKNEYIKKIIEKIK